MTARISPALLAVPVSPAIPAPPLAVLVLVLVTGLSGCAALGEAPVAGTMDSGSGGRRVLDPATVIQDGWRHVALRGATDYRIETVDDRLAIVADGDGAGGASILIRETPVSRCEDVEWEVEWEWRVDRLQRSADLTRRDAEDVAASVFVVFGDPGMIEMPEPTPTLRYVWTNERIAAGSVVDSPYLPGVVRSIVVRSGESRTGEWLTERRRLDLDFETAFGEAPSEGVHAVAVFTDNDQTREPVRAYYRWIALGCVE